MMRHLPTQIRKIQPDEHGIPREFFIRWNEKGQICFLQEFGCNENRYDPYAQGEEPVFREEPTLWF